MHVPIFMCTFAMCMYVYKTYTYNICIYVYVYTKCTYTAMTIA